MPDLNTAVVDTKRAEQRPRLQRRRRPPQVLALGAASQVRAVHGDDRPGCGLYGRVVRGGASTVGVGRQERVLLGQARGAGPIRGTTGRYRRCRPGRRASRRTAGLRPPRHRYASAGAGPSWPGQRARHRPRRRRALSRFHPAGLCAVGQSDETPRLADSAARVAPSATWFRTAGVCWTMSRARGSSAASSRKNGTAYLLVGVAPRRRVQGAPPRRRHRSRPDSTRASHARPRGFRPHASGSWSKGRAADRSARLCRAAPARQCADRSGRPRWRCPRRP